MVRGARAAFTTAVAVVVGGSVALAGCGGGGPSPSRSWQEREVFFASGSNRLFGVLSLPTRGGPYPAVVLLSGSDRGGVDTPLLRMHAQRLAGSGFAVLRYDPPGVGQSAGERGFETFQDRSREALAAADALRSRPEIDRHEIGLWGESQGGWVTQMAAAASPGIAFIVSISGSGVSAAEQQVYSVEAQSRAAGFTPDEVAKAGLFARLLIDWQLSHDRYREENEAVAHRLGRGPWSSFSALVYAAKRVAPAASLRRGIALLKAIRGQRWARFLHLDTLYLPTLVAIPPEQAETARAAGEQSLLVEPKQFLTRVRCPVLALFGEDDTVVPARRSAQLYRRYLRQAGNDAATILVLADAGHSLGGFGSDYWKTLIDWLERETAS